nr:GNAT family N-acetyltransferase [Methanohalophilus sp.]
MEEPFNEIHSIAVHASYRGKGVGKSLLMHALNRFNGIVYVRTTAPGFFLKEGFKKAENIGKEDLWEDCANCNLLDSCRQHFLYFKTTENNEC